MKHKYLKTAQNILSNTYFIEFKDDNAIEICINEKSLPFAFVVVDPKFPNTFLLSFATDLVDALISADVALALSRITNTELVEGFYVDNKHETHWGEDAYNTMQKEINPLDQDDNNLLKMPAISDLKN